MRVSCWTRTRSMSFSASAGFFTTSANNASEAFKLGFTARRLATVRSCELLTLTSAPNRSSVSANCVALSVVVPSDSNVFSIEAKPRLSVGSAAYPASKLTATRTVGTALRFAKNTLMPFFSLPSSTVGKSTFGVVPGSGILLRSAP